MNLVKYLDEPSFIGLNFFNTTVKLHEQYFNISQKNSFSNLFLGVLNYDNHTVHTQLPTKVELHHTLSYQPTFT